MTEKLKVGVFKFASCDGCQLALLDAEDELLELADTVEIAYFLEASSRILPGPYDISFVEGSITTSHDRDRIRQIRQDSKQLITIGACATAGGIQALRNWGDHEEFVRFVYPSPEYIDTLDRSTAISDHVKVDYELRGCPINQYQLIEVVAALVHHRKPRLPQHSVCLDCKRSGTVCVAVAQGIPCLGPVTHTGCGAICPSYNRGCYGCYGPVPQANAPSLSGQYLRAHTTADRLVPLLRNFNANAPAFRSESDRIEPIQH